LLRAAIVHEVREAGVSTWSRICCVEMYAYLIEGCCGTLLRACAAREEEASG